MAGLLSCHSLRISILLVHLLLHFSETHLIVPKQPIIATAGEDITLPCHLVQVENVATKTLEWTRPDLDPRFVFVWRAGQDYTNVKNPSYKDRSSLFIDELKHGNISLKLSKVKPADEGRYRCYIPDKNEEAFIDLVVGAVTLPVIKLQGIDRDNAGVILECKSKGWHPKPEVLWLDCEGNPLPAGPTQTLKGPDDLYTVSSRVTVEKKCNNDITCRVQQKNINQSRETHIQISDDFFIFTTTSASSIIIGLAVSWAVSIMLVLFGVFFIWKKNKTKVKRDHCDESEEQEMKNRSKNDQTETDQEQEKLIQQDTVPSSRDSSNEEQRRKEAENKAESMTKKVDLLADGEKVKDEKQPLQHLSDAKEKQPKSSLSRFERLLKPSPAVTEEALDKNQAAELKLKDTEEQNHQPKMMDAGSSELETQSESSKLYKPQSEKCQRNFPEQNQSSSANHSLMRCDIILEEVNRHGHYICLKNNSSEDTLMRGWELKLQINQTQTITYKFKWNYTLKAGRKLTLRKSGTRNPYTDNDDLMWVDLVAWSSEDNLKIRLISNTGAEHTLK